MRRISFLLVAFFALTAMIPQLSQAQSGMSKVRVMHTSPDAPDVDVFVNGNAALSNVPFFALSNSLSVPARSYRIQVAPTGTGIGNSVINATLLLEVNKVYTIAVVNKVANIEPLALVDNVNPVPAEKHAFVHYKLLLIRLQLTSK